MYYYKNVRNFILNRNIKLFKQEYNWDYKFLTSPYRKIKTIFNLEIASILVYYVSNTNIKANHVTLFGVIWVFLGTIFIASNTDFIFFGLFIYFTKLIPDYMDGSLAHLKKQQSKLGFELDLWAGEINKIGVIIGVTIYIFNLTKNNLYLIILIFIITLNYIDPRKHLSKTKFSITIYKKKLKTHIQRKKKNINKVFNFIKQLNFDGRSWYSDFLILLILINEFYNYNLILVLLPWLWLILNFLILLRAKYLVFFKS